jgi:DNA-binding transcriptional regulator of glucitol operon
MYPIMWLLAAVVAGWAVQLYMTYRQSMAFNADVHRLRTSGTVSVGVGGRRYRGGRAYVAVAVDETGVVRDTLCLRGFTTFARGVALPALVGVRLNVVRGDREIPGLSRSQREAARQAAELFRSGAGQQEGKGTSSESRESPVS